MAIPIGRHHLADRRRTRAARRSTDLLPRLRPSEGVTLGLLLATSVWAWVALVDLVVGEPFRTFALLGGVVAFTVVHYALCILYGRVLVWAVRAAREQPSAIMGVLVLSLLFQVAFAMLTILLSALGLGDRAWVGIFGGSLVSSAVAFRFLSRRYPLAAMMKAAQEEP
jgi:hypothetical protein